LIPNPFPNWIDGQFVEFDGSGQFLAVAKSIEGSSDGVHDRRPVNAKVHLLPCNYTGFKVEIKGLSNTSFNDSIKTALEDALDIKRPNIIALNYPAENAKINKNSLSALVQNVIGNNTFTTFSLLNAEDQEIDEESLGIGSLAYLAKLTVNNEVVFDADAETSSDDEQNSDEVSDE